MDRRAGVSEDEAPFLTLRADHVLLSPGKNTPMKLYVAACESLPGGRAPGAVKAAVGENRWRPDLRLTEKEAGAVADDGAPSMVLGRSGTGKTVCMARRIARDRALAIHLRVDPLQRRRKHAGVDGGGDGGEHGVVARADEGRQSAVAAFDPARGDVQALR